MTMQGWKCSCGAWVPYGVTHSCGYWPTNPVPTAPLPERLLPVLERIAAALERLADDHD